MQKPTLSKTHIAFSYAGDLWLVSREGGEARLLTSGEGTKTDPVFSPDSNMMAFSGDYDGNVDVYVMPSEGGVPRRLTHHPAVDEVVGRSPDGKSVLFRSSRKPEKLMEGANDFTVSFDGKKMLYSKGRRDNKKWFISSATAPARGEGGAGALRFSNSLNLASGPDKLIDLGCLGSSVS